MPSLSYFVNYFPTIVPTIKAIEAEILPTIKVSAKALVSPYPTTFHRNNPNNINDINTPDTDIKKACVESPIPKTKGIRGINPKNRKEIMVAKAEKIGLESPGLGIP